MTDNLVRFEAEITSLADIRSRVIWPEAEGPWIKGTMEDLIIHFTYATWMAYNLRRALSMIITSKDEGMARTISDLLTRIVSSMGALEMAEIHLSARAIDELKRDRIEP